MLGVFDQPPDVPGPLRMRACELTELNDLILVHEQGQGVQASFRGPRLQAEKERPARLRIAQLGKHYCSQIAHRALGVGQEWTELQGLYS